jgi:adenine-specific DNA-methyltransferase
MALIDDLLERIGEPALQEAIRGEVQKLRSQKSFGLVFERHIPELTVVTDAPIKAGDRVRRRDRSAEDREFVVEEVNSRSAVVREVEGEKAGPPERLRKDDLACVKRFGEPVFPALKLLEQVVRDEEAPTHAVINGENLYVLQLLTLFGEGFADCVYLDPPYNTGKRDWRYNNHFVDRRDGWRHSKWLSFMERRLKLAKRLLGEDGVLAISIDENEHHHLVCLLEQMFVGWDIVSVAIAHNPRGIQGDNFSITNDFAVFVTPPEQKVIAPRPVAPEELTERRFRVWGNESLRTDAKNCFYPIYVEENSVAGFGKVPPADFHPEQAVVDLGNGRLEVWPIDNSGIERKWRNERKTVERIAHLLEPEWKNGTLQISIVKDSALHKSIWSGSRYDSGSHGKRLLKEAFQVDFDYPKSIYTMRDLLYACVGQRPDAVVVDYMGGSGTTLNALCLLNAEDGGRRRCILATNNEVGEKAEKRLLKAGLAPGDVDYEAEGIFRAVTWPRCKAAITGSLENGAALPGDYLGGRARNLGFEENVAFFELVYLDPDEVELDRAFSGLEPVLWLSAGARRPYRPHAGNGYFVEVAEGYAVLFDDGLLEEFSDVLREQGFEGSVFHVTTSPEAFAELASLSSGKWRALMLYRDYLSECRDRARLQT